MCGRFALGLLAEVVQQLPGYPALHNQVGEWVNEDQFVPRYNIAPRSQAPVIRRRKATVTATDNGGGKDKDGQYVLHTMKWGLVPHWSKSEATHLSTINARAENLIEGGGLWGSIKGRKRCVVLAQGYYEWLKKGKEKTPHFTRHKDGRLMVFAGLYDIAHIEERDEPLWTFTIVTTAANKEFEWLHDRQPVVLSSQEAIETWLDTSSQSWTKNLNQLLGPYNDPQSPLECYAVPKEVGKVGTESSTFIEPITKRKDGIEAMFSKQKRTPQTVKGSAKAETSSPSGSQTKRKHGTDSEYESVSPKKTKKTKQEVPDGSEDSDVEIMAAPAPRSSPRKTKESSFSPSSSQRSGKKVKASKGERLTSPKKTDEAGDPKSAKITTFFTKT